VGDDSDSGVDEIVLVDLKSFFFLMVQKFRQVLEMF
jgi:hypothetical protein